VIEASLKPFINFVWMGAILILSGFGVALYRRSAEEKGDQKIQRKQKPAASRKSELIAVTTTNDRELHPVE
jgi:hypothetical protein